MRTYLTAGAFCFAWSNPIAVYRIVPTHRQEKVSAIVAAPQGRNRLRHSTQRETLGRPVLPQLAGRQKHARNVYAHSEEECERLLAEMMAEMKAEIAAEKEHLNVDPKAG